jgi:nuclear GTP-binding protein
VFLVDCPGVVHDSSHNSEAESVLKGVVRVESLGTRASEYVPALLDRVDPKYIARTYGIPSWSSPDDYLEKMARKTGKLLKKGEPDVNAVGRMMLADFQRGKLPWFVQPPDEAEGAAADETTFFEPSDARRPPRDSDEGATEGDVEDAEDGSDEEDEEDVGDGDEGEDGVEVDEVSVEVHGDAIEASGRPVVTVEPQDLSRLKTSERLVLGSKRKR